jgi:uncharacterized protein YndB with AHSA1/START domain
MSERSVTHATFVVERHYDASPARAFNAWADATVKARWFGGPDHQNAYHELDFRVGGREVNRGGPPDGPIYTYDARFQDIVPDRRIVYSYDMHMDQTRISVSLMTVEFEQAGAGTRLIVTEQGAFLDGHDTPAQREQGMRELLGALDSELRRRSTTA